MAKTTTVVAREVIAGDWGSGDARIASLKKAGYNPTVIQDEVNRLLCCRELIIQNMQAWATKIADSHKYKYVAWTEAYGHECAVCHPHDGANHGWQCIGFAMAVWHHAGLPIPCACGTIANEEWEAIFNAKTDAAALKIAQDYLKLKDIKVIRNKNGIPKSQAKPGDLGALFINGDEYQHTFVVMPNDKIADSTHAGGYSGDIGFRNFSGGYVSKLKILIRYTGKGFTTPAKKTVDELAHEVINAMWGSGDSRQRALTECGYDYNAVQKRVNEILNPPKPTPTPSKATTLIAVDVINGDYGSGQKRVDNLRKAGYNPTTIQNEVNRLLTESKKKSIDTLAHEVIDGYWRSGAKREKVLKACGCNYNAIQKRVNEILNPPKPTPTGGYTGEFPSYRVKKTNAQVIADTIKWAKWIAADNRFHYGYGADAHHNGCYFCGTQPASKKKSGIVDWQFTYCCNPFVGAAWAHGGLIPKAISLCNSGRSWDFNIGSGYDASSLFTKMGKLAVSKLKPGDVLCTGSHVMLYVGDGKIAEASGGDDNKRGSKKWNNSIHITKVSSGDYDRVYRYNSSVDADIVMKHGECGRRVLLWQKYLDWYFDGAFSKECGAPDEYYGDNTLKWTKKFQEKEVGKGTGDGNVGPKTIEAAKKVRK